MNIMSVEMLKSKYVSVEHPTILVDGVSLDLLLHNLYGQLILRFNSYNY